MLIAKGCFCAAQTLLVLIAVCSTLLFSDSFRMKQNSHLLYSIKHLKRISMSITQEVSSVDSKEGKDYRKFQPKYMTLPLSSREDLGKKLTFANRRDFCVGVELRNQYIKYRLLSSEEEMTAGKFSNVGLRLDTVRKTLQETLQREPSNLEWAEACNLSLEQLYTYYALATTARQRLVQHNFRLVDFWARRLIEHTNGGKFISYYELVTEGVIGLTKAAAQYDGRGAFIKFAQHYVRNELYRGMTRLRPGSFLSHKTVMLSVRAHKARERLQETYQRKPTDQEVATELKVSVRTLREELDTAALKKTIISASAKISGGAEDALENAKTYLDMLANSDKSIFTADTLQWKIEFQQALDEVLSPIEKRTLTLRYGLLDGKSRSIDRTAELMCHSAEGIRKIIIRAMTKLRASQWGSMLQEGPPPVSPTAGKHQRTSY